MYILSQLEAKTMHPHLQHMSFSDCFPLLANQKLDNNIYIYIWIKMKNFNLNEFLNAKTPGEFDYNDQLTR